MVKVELRCNLDSVRAVLSAFPRELIAVPAVGARIRASRPVTVRNNAGETRTIEALEMKVVGVVYGARATMPARTWQICTTCKQTSCPYDENTDCPVFSEQSRITEMPYVEIELHHEHARELGLL